MVVEDSDRSRKPVKNQQVSGGLKVDEAFIESPSYIDRYAIALRRMRHERDLDAVCLVATDKATRSYRFPDPTMSITAFEASIRARVTEVLGALGR